MEFLLIIKFIIFQVNGGSPAEKAGLQAGDSVIKVNTTEVFSLRHKEAQDVIVKAGQNFDITVQRSFNFHFSIFTIRTCKIFCNYFAEVEAHGNHP